jgi:Arc/MetJ-type ribon-helix-helix transcriptional regulator
MRAPKLSGRWLVSGYEAGKGRIIGELSIEPGAAEDEFQTRTTLKYLASGQTVQRKGKSLVYAGYSWRGRNEAAGADGAVEHGAEKGGAIVASGERVYGDRGSGLYSDGERGGGADRGGLMKQAIDVNLSEEDTKKIQEQIDSGAFETVEEVIHDALLAQARRMASRKQLLQMSDLESESGGQQAE